MSKNFLMILVGIVLAFAAIFWFTKEDAGAPTGETTGGISNHVYGDGNSGVVLIEYGDFQCPACGAYYPVIKSIKEKYKNEITFQFRNFPLTAIHPNAMAAHRAAEAAAKQGKFWEMHDLLYEQQQSWSQSSAAVSVFEGYAQQLALDMEKFKQDFASGDVNATINADLKAGQDIGANSTPTFVLNGQKIEENPADQEAFDRLIQEAIDNASDN